MIAFCEHNPIDNPYWCNAIYGYCQFQISSMINSFCPIYNAYPKNPIHITEDVNNEFLQINSHMTIYDKDNKLISLGDTAFQNYTGKINIEIPFVRYIGKKTFTDCFNLEVLNFSSKSDDEIPVLASTTAFMTSDEKQFINKTFKILIPIKLYDKWINSPNWSLLKEYIEGV